MTSRLMVCSLCESLIVSYFAANSYVNFCQLAHAPRAKSRLSCRRLPLALLLVVLNVLVHATVLFALAALKALLPFAPIRRALSRALIVIAEQWIAVNGLLFALFTPTQWQVDGLDGLHRDGWYLVLSNHQSWV